MLVVVKLHSNFRLALLVFSFADVLTVVNASALRFGWLCLLLVLLVGSSDGPTVVFSLCVFSPSAAHVRRDLFPSLCLGIFRGADPVLGVEMASTGEVACFGVNKEEAFLKVGCRW